jgi:hypothetical protein
MTRDKLKELIERRLVDNATRPNTSPAVFQIKGEHLRGVGVAHLPRGEAYSPHTPIQSSGICTVDDREPGMQGPISFHPLTMHTLLEGASLIAIDSAEISEEIYNDLLDEVKTGQTILAVLTTEDRHSIWREFIGMHWHGEELFEVVLVKGDPLRTLETFVTRLDRESIIRSPRAISSTFARVT